MEFVVGEHYSPLLAQGNTRKVGRWRKQSYLPQQDGRIIASFLRVRGTQKHPMKSR
jgi:hypothetical protein